MAISSRLRRPTVLGALFACVAASTACSVIWPSSVIRDLHKLYVKDYRLNVTARLIAGTSSKEFEDAKISNLRTLGNIGLVYSPNYVFVADPELVIAASSPIQLPADQLVDEPAGFSDTGELITEKVLRKPLFIISKSTLTYTVPGYNIAPITITQNLPVKSNEYRLKLPGASQVTELQAAFASNPSKAPTLSGTVTISCDVTDLDPVAAEKTFVVARSFPLSYSYSPFTPETTASSEPVPVVILTTPPTAPPTATPTATPAAAATAQPATGSVSVPIGTTSVAPSATPTP
ncbi:MAG: hypothetical protein JWM80_2007 [Cyanobacteria bacterium RYN_339]|nr:hypothetical protein [Cyanobacteria bacterium RYN_339]